MARLNLGCGDDYRRGWVNVDVSEAVPRDRTVDLDEYPWPFDDDEFELIYAAHVFEHLADPLAAFEECARILEAGGSLRWAYPIGHTRFEDPTHRHYWSWFTPEHLLGERVHGHETGLPFSIEQKTISWQSPYRPLRWLIAIGERLAGPGPWIGQTPSVCGEVRVVLRYDG